MTNACQCRTAIVASNPAVVIPVFGTAPLRILSLQFVRRALGRCALPRLHMVEGGFESGGDLRWITDRPEVHEEETWSVVQHVRV
jgi:hypothetical protein